MKDREENKYFTEERQERKFLFHTILITSRSYKVLRAKRSMIIIIIGFDTRIACFFEVLTIITCMLQTVSRSSTH